MDAQQMLTLGWWRRSPLTLWHSQDSILCYLPPTLCSGITPSHFDDVFMLWFICQGQADLLIDGVCYPTPGGSLIWTGPQIVHRHRAAGCMEVILGICSSAIVEELWHPFSSSLSHHNHAPHDLGGKASRSRSKSSPNVAFSSHVIRYF